MSWASTLTREQAAACRAIMGVKRANRPHGEGWRVFVDRAIGPPTYVELRLYDHAGRLSRTWVIDDRRAWR
jgi:hypothetical protein